MKRRWKAFLGLAVSALCLWLALRKVDPAELLTSLRAVSPAALPGLALFIVGDLALRALRWKLLLGGRAPLGTLFRLEAIGLAVNNVLPMRLGELVRTYLAARRLGLPLLTVAASIVVERVLDLMTLLGLFLVLGDLGEALPWMAGARGAALGGFLALAAALSAAAWFEKSPPLLPAGRWPALERFIEQLLLGASALRSFSGAAAVLVLGGLLWMTGACLLYASGAAMGLAGLTFPLAVVALMASAASTALPAVPGYFGTYELAVSKALGASGLSEASGFALAALVHVLQFAVVTGLGLAFLSKEGLSLDKLDRELSAGTNPPAKEEARP